MRIVLLTIVTAALAWGLWTLLVDPVDEITHEEPPPPEPAPKPPTADDHAINRAKLTTGTLVVTVRDAKGGVPPQAEAGYRYGGEDRFRFVNKKGEVRFTDAPLGTLTVVARAPGFKEDSQPHPLQAGLRLDVYVVLRRESKPNGP